MDLLPPQTLHGERHSSPATPRHCKLTLSILVTQSCLPHIGHFNGTFRARVHEEVAVQRMEFRRGDDFC